MKLIEIYGSLDNYFWRFVDGNTINKWSHISQIPASNCFSDRLSKDLKKNGFAFVGSTICYSFLQAAASLMIILLTASAIRYSIYQVPLESQEAFVIFKFSHYNLNSFIQLRILAPIFFGWIIINDYIRIYSGDLQLSTCFLPRNKIQIQLH